jgi:DNA primase
MMIPQEYLKELLAKTNILCIISAEIDITRHGANYFGVCPFHRASKAPSSKTFSVAPEKNFFHCFSCGAHGSAIQFCMQFKGIKFLEAVEFLAKKAGLPPPSLPPTYAEAAKRISEISNIFLKATQYYQLQLRGSTSTIELLKAAGISGTTAAKFKVGYAPDDWSGLKKAYDVQYEAECIDVGLTVKSKNGRVYDRFRDRLIFPLTDYKGNIVGMAGTSLKGAHPEHLNSRKNEAGGGAADFFGFDQAEKQIHIQRSVILAPTCFDVLVLHEYGVLNSVAIVQSSTTREEHLEYLFRKSEQIIVCCSNTSLGRRKAWNVLKHALPQISGARTVHFVLVPAEETASSLIQQDRGKERFTLLIKAALPLSEFFLQEIASRNDNPTIEGRSALLDEAEKLLKRMVDPHLKSLLAEAVDDMARDRHVLLHSTEEHDHWLAERLSDVTDSMLIISPWITRQGIERFNLCQQIRSAVNRGASVSIYTDVDFNLARKKNSPTGDLFDDGAFAELSKAGAHIIFVKRIHSKVVVADTNYIAIGSFNWLSAARAGQHKRQEISVVQQAGGIAAKRQALLLKLLAEVVEYPGHS